ncbi:hydantoinase B/oxoprolinase family protein [Caballeronia sp. dw_19]|uniref:hydantoinase B/oxoprolinase family protein n=1 Tax=Caballeronia sp. dw_19 TaxID=2719791 RepID=UPI001BCACC57|nr:hydantoinase B/oxoprolinase family protein [Caballeronia sp. dw_19]
MNALRKLDAIAMEVFSNRLLSITEEMGNTLIRSAFSSNIKERKDCSVALFDGSGQLIAQASHIPVHLGALSGAVEAAIKKYGTGMKPGDAYLSNDAYLAGGSHPPDLTVVGPVFVDGKLEFFIANVGHHTDVGGAVPGSNAPHLRTVWEEGLRIPSTRIVDDGVMLKDIIDLVAQNSREPDDRVHDLRAQIATNEKGRRLLQELAGEIGMEKIQRTINDIFYYTEQRLRKRISELPSHVGEFEEFLDDDGLGGDPVPIRASVRAIGDRLVVDFTGSGPEARGSYNIPLNALRASVYFAVKALLDPGLLPNCGMFVPIEIVLPEKSIINPQFPAAIGCRATTAQRVAGTVIGALGKLLTNGRRMASCNDVMPAMVFSGPSGRRGGRFVYLETLGGGAGGRENGDGMDGVQVHITNTSNLPVEALEIEYPLMVEEYALVSRSGGRGEFRGGMGLARQIRALDPEVVCSVRCDGSMRGAEGLDGGEPGYPSRIVINHGQSTEEVIQTRATVQMSSGTTIRLETPGGGGFGNPAQRARNLVDADVANEVC